MDAEAYLVVLLGAVLTFVVVLMSIETGHHKLIIIAGLAAAGLSAASGILSYRRRSRP